MQQIKTQQIYLQPTRALQVSPLTQSEHAEQPMRAKQVSFSANQNKADLPLANQSRTGRLFSLQQSMDNWQTLLFLG